MAFPDLAVFPVECVPAAAVSATTTVKSNKSIPNAFHGGSDFTGEVLACQVQDVVGITGDDTNRYSLAFCRGTIAAPVIMGYLDLVTGVNLTADVATELTLEGALNAGSSTLNGAITKAATTLVVTSAASFPAAATFYVRVDDEIMKVTLVASTTFTITRAQCGTVAAAHATGATIVTNGNYVTRRVAAGETLHVIATKGGSAGNIPVTARFTFWVSPSYQPAGITLPV